MGGGILNAGTLTLTDSTVTGNAATAAGGGIANLSDGSLAITGSTINDNQAQFGGGIYSSSSGGVRITTSSLENNKAVGANGQSASSAGGAGGGGAGLGGAVMLKSGSLILADSTLSGDTATGGSGGTGNGNYGPANGSGGQGGGPSGGAGGTYQPASSYYSNASGGPGVAGGFGSGGGGGGAGSNYYGGVAGVGGNAGFGGGGGGGGGTNAGGGSATPDSQYVQGGAGGEGGQGAYGSSGGGGGGGGAGLGGGVFLYGSNTSATITDSTFTGDGAVGGAGGGAYGGATYGNNGAASGGALFASGASISLTDSTVSGNSVQAAGSASNSAGGGVYSYNGSVTLQNTILSGNNNPTNTAASAGPDLAGIFSLTDNGHNLLGTNVTASGTGDQFSNTPMLSPLGYYGGPTETMTPLPGSLAIGNGAPSGPDQRGFAQSSDIGAFQTQTSLVVNTADDTATGAEPSGELSLRDAINLANVLTPSGSSSPSTITFDPSLSGDTITLAGVELPQITGDVNISGQGASQLIVSGANQSRVFDIASGAVVSISDLTIEQGSAPESGNLYGLSGGGIRNAGTLTLTDSTVADSVADDGGGIANFGDMRLLNSTLSGKHRRRRRRRPVQLLQQRPGDADRQHYLRQHRPGREPDGLQLQRRRSLQQLQQLFPQPAVA